LTGIDPGARRQYGAARFSVVVEGYNESLDLGSAIRTVEGLLRQTVPLDSIEVILVGTTAQKAAWDRQFAGESRFFGIRAIAADGAHYYQLKNVGARAATGDIIALLDADVIPEPGWLAAVDASMRMGADFSAGISRFYSESGRRLGDRLLDLPGSISWGFVVGEPSGEWIEPRGFLSHNVAFRRAALLRNTFAEQYGRTCAGSFLYSRLRETGARGVLNPRQRVAHAFSLPWWLGKLHPRFGYEVYRLRRLGSPVVSQRAQALHLLEPALTMIWHVVLDVPQWFRYSSALGWGMLGQIAALPLLLLFSLLARGSEMIAMYATMANRAKMEAFALRS
jgi:glycosyltransferase involved in cell wall biosynthesis